jgi:LacI family transcriptional regulator
LSDSILICSPFRSSWWIGYHPYLPMSASEGRAVNRRPTSADVAKLAGVSRQTVSGFMNGTRTVSPATASRINAAFRQLEYRPNSAARELRGIATKRVGLVVADTSGPIWGNAIKAVQQHLAASGYQVLLYDNDEDPEREAASLRMILAERVDGVIFIPVPGSYADLIQRTAARVPIVQMIRCQFDNIDSVNADNFNGARRATEHLLDLGYERIACVAGTFAVSSTRERLDGYRAALADRGVPFSPGLVIAFPPDPATSSAAAASMLSGRPRPDAVLALNHLQVFGFLKAARDLRIPIPKCLGIIAYDEMPWSALTDPPLTSISQPIGELARRAGSLLVERIEAGGPPAEPARIVLPVTMIDRCSCGTEKAHVRLKAASL